MKTLYLDFYLISLNEYIKVERGSKFGAATLKKSQTFQVEYLARKQKFKLDDKKYDVKFIWTKPDNRRDHDNICFAKKFILDGLVQSGALKNDNPRYINNFQDVFILDKTKEYVSCVVEFTEV